MSIQSEIAAIGGNTWASSKILAIWPWPAVMVGEYEYKFTEDDYRAFTALLKPGDILLSQTYPAKLSNFFIGKTVFKHGAVYTGDVKGIKNREHGFIDRPTSLGVDHLHGCTRDKGIYTRTITHAISEGVVCQDILRLTKHADYVIAVRPWKSAYQQQVIVDYALKQVGLGYNFDFTPSGPKEFYCTELCVAAIRAADLPLPATTKKGVSLFKPWVKADVTLSDSILLKYAPVCCSVSCLDPKFYKKSMFGDGVRMKIVGADNAES
jgi:cell wall-associated NlpC family hydrolase